MSYGDRCALYRGDMLTGGISRAYCAGATCSGVLGYAEIPGSAVAFVGGTTSFVSFACSSGTSVVVTSAVSGSNHCEPGVSETIVLGFSLDLI